MRISVSLRIYPNSPLRKLQDFFCELSQGSKARNTNCSDAEALRRLSRSSGKGGKQPEHTKLLGAPPGRGPLTPFQD